ncbi:MAG: EF-P lysine aminoacylase GenX [Gammaproteobacteria bacterium]|nr:EF-P lysine aminoacylase GenX [Gammaproteobacteria bacterium]
MSLTEDVSWKPVAGVAAAQQRALLLQRARDFFAQRNVLEIDTPILGEAAVSDPGIESITTKLAVAPARDFYLQTSPEFYMKRLLAAGFPDIFEIGKVFRDAELGRVHQPEFTLVEWYRLDVELEAIIQEAVDFIGALVDSSISVGTVDRFSYRDAFRHFTDIDPMSTSMEQLLDHLDADRNLRTSMGGSVDACLDLIMATQVAPQFNKDRLTVVQHYPASQAALARLCPDNAAVADRFEVFFGSLELANGYVELTDVAEQRRRCTVDQNERRTNNAPVRPLDEKFMASLESGLPACAGVAVGFDRLLMIHADTNDIRDVRHFPIEIS